MKKVRLYIISAVVMMLATSALMAQSLYQDQVKATSTTVTKQDGVTTLTMNIVLDDLKIDKNHLLVITPVISANDGRESTHLRPMVIKGSRRNIMLNRPFEWKGKPTFDTNEQYMPVRKNNTPQTIAYTETLQQSDWHKNARLWLETEVMGCAECDLGGGEIPLLGRIFAEVYKPTYAVSFVTPEAEPVKQRSETYSANFTYRVGRYELLPNFGDNASELEKVDKVIREVQADKDLTFTNVEINGYASPEGSYSSNMTLSKNRANTFSDYLVKKYGLNSDQFSVKWHGEDWDGLSKAVQASQLDKRDDILSIINTEPNHDARDAKLIAIDNRRTYNTLLNDYYPPLRRNDYTVGFIARAFDVEEAKQLVKTRPNLLSLNEMFLVAQTYEKGSDNYKEVFDVASRLYPADPVSNINAAAVALEGGDVDGAHKRLEKLKDTPAAWNNFAIVLANKGEYEEALKLFLRAGAQGDNVAAENAKELQKMLDSM